MLIREFAARLDALFEVHRFHELAGWDFAMPESARRSLLAAGSPAFQTAFNGLIPFALPVESEINRVYLVVFPEYSCIERILESGQANGQGRAVIVTHHPVDMETNARGFLQIPASQLDQLANSGIALYILHAPLDCHSTISTSGALADGLGLTRERTFAPYYDGDCGIIGVQEPEPFSAFAGRVRALCELPDFNLDQVRFSGHTVARVAVVAGGGDDVSYMAEAEALGCDTYLAGHWWTPHSGEWCDGNRSQIRHQLADSAMNLLSASHDGSELVVFRDRLQPLFRDWGLDVHLVRQDDHWR